MVFLFILLILVFVIIFSKLKVEINDFKFKSTENRHVNDDYNITIGIYILSKVPIAKILINKEKINKIKSNKKIENKIKKINVKLIQDKNEIDKRILKNIKKLKINIKNISLKIQFGTENAALTAIIVPIISSIISLILRKKVKYYKNQKYVIEPIYINQNLINIKVSGIFEIKMIHIINIIYILKKKEGVKKKYERASNRRSYDYSYE